MLDPNLIAIAAGAAVFLLIMVPYVVSNLRRKAYQQQVVETCAWVAEGARQAPITAANRRFQNKYYRD